MSSSSPSSFLARMGPLVAARMASAVIATVIPLVLARLLSLDEYGTYKQLFLLTLSVGLILPFGVAQSLYYFVPREDESTSYVGNALAFCLMAGALGGLGLLVGMPSIAAGFSNPALAEYALPLAVYTFGTVASFPLEITLTSRARMKAAGATYFVSEITKAAVMVTPIVLGAGLSAMVWLLAALTLCRTLVAWGWLVLRTDRAGWLDRAKLWAQLRYATPMGLAMLLSIPQRYMHQFGVASLYTPEVFALYAVGTFQVPLVELLYTPSNEALMVRIAELERAGRLEEGLASFREVVGKMALAILPLTAFLVVIAPDFIGAFFGSKFMDAVPLFRMAALAALFSILPLDELLRSRGATRRLFWSYAIKLGATLPLLYLGIRFFGLYGAVGAWLASSAIGKLTLLLAVPRLLSTPARRVRLIDLFPGRELLKAAGPALGAALAVGVGRVLLSGAVSEEAVEGLVRFAPLMVAGMLFGSCYVAMLMVLGLQPSALVAALKPKRKG